MTDRVPARRFYGELMQTTMGGMLSIRDMQNRILAKSGYKGRSVLGYKLPVWQRPEVWTDDQCIKFLMSIYMGVGLGTFMVNFSRSMADDDTHMLLLDGQQRLRSIERYWNGELAVPGDDGNSYFWGDLTEREHAHFERINFPWICTGYGTDAELREAYNRHNFGGTEHAADQRA
jgi:hypothetical protein